MVFGLNKYLKKVEVSLDSTIPTTTLKPTEEVYYDDGASK